MTSDIDWLLSKLQPLLPTEVSRWKRLRPQIDAATLGLLDQQIRQAAIRHLGDQAESRVLLSLPPQELLRGPIQLGRVQYAGQHHHPCGIGLTDVLNHISIFGRSGAGKSNLVFHLLEELHKENIPFLFLDWKRTARHWIGRLTPTPPFPTPTSSSSPSLSLARCSIYTPGRSLAPLAFNPFTPPPALELATYANHLVDCLAEAYDLGDGAISIIHKALTDLYDQGNLSPSPSDILSHIHASGPKGRAIGWTQSAVRALRSLESLSIADSAHSSPQALAESLLTRNTIIELDGLSGSAKRFLAPMLCLFLYHQQLATKERERLNLVIVVEEAHHLFLREQHRARESILSMIARQSRELGIAFIWADQHPHLIASSVLGNSAVTCFLNLKDPADLSKAAALCGLTDDREKRCFTHLPVGHAVVKLQNRWRKAFLIRIPQIPIRKGLVTDAQVRRLAQNGGPDADGAHRPVAGMVRAARDADARSTLDGDSETLSQGGQSESSVRTHSADSRGVSVDSGGSEGIHGIDEETDHAPADALALLEDVAALPLDGVGERYRRLRMSGLRGNRAKEWLIRQTLVEEQAVEIGTTRRMILRLTKKGWKMLKRDPPAWSMHADHPGRASIEHEYWQRWYARELENAGWQVEFEAAREGGRVDLRATRGNERIAVEIETGRSDVCANVRACVNDRRFSRIIVIATTREAHRHIERMLVRQGLLDPVRIVLLCAPAGLPLADHGKREAG